jgi:maintenance of mitochondrial morphology protein 1
MSSGLTFTQGLLVGQLSVVLLIGAFIKFFIFGEAPAPTRKPSSQKQYASHHRAPSLHSLASSQASPPQSLRNKASANNILRPVPQSATDTASILRKTYYQIAPNRPQTHGQSIHQPESLDWFNVLIAQTIAQYRQTAYNLKDASPSSPPSILTSLEAAINDPTKRPSFIGDIKITEISLGEEFPIFSNVRVIAVEDELNPGSRGQRLQALVDVDLSDDNLTLAIETSLILNYPKPMSAVLPVALAVSVIRFSGTLSVSFVPAPPETAPPVTEGSSASRPKTNLAFSFLPDYRLDLSVRSLIGNRSRLQDVPKIAQLVEARVQAWFEERVVEPRVQVVGLPGLWPRMGKTRVRDGSDEDKRQRQETEGLKPEPQRLRRVSDNFPTQEETEAIFEGLRYRGGGTGGQREERSFTSEEDMRMPGALPP